jgi:hypothetical protein
MHQQVRAERFVEAVRAKLNDARLRLHDLRESERPTLTNLNPAEIIGHFLTAARGVYQTAKTFAEGATGKLAFDTWYQGWLERLPRAESDLWRSLTDNRDAHIHGEGASLIDTEVDVTERLDPMIFQGPLALGVQRPRMTKVGKRFEAYAGRPASDVCNDFLELAERFVADFSRDHASHIT